MKSSSRHNGAALVIVLGFLVILSAIAAAYLSRTTADRQLAHGTFSETRADILARSALDVVVGDVKQEIVRGSTSPAPVYGPASSPSYLYSPSSTANIVPLPDGTPSDQSIPNLVKRSVRSDNPASPGIGSRASASNSTDVSLNARSITGARWNKHYLIPRVSPTPSADSDTTPTGSFTAPDWVLVTRNGPTPIPSWTPIVKDASATNPSYVLGRYAYAVYDEGGLLDANVTGYPSPASSPATYIQTVGRKGLPPLTDLSTTGLSWGAINDLIGTRNYATTQPGGSFTNFSFDSTAASRYVTAIFSNNNGFLTVNSTVWNNGTDQAFASRQALIDLQRKVNFTVAALPFLGVFSRDQSIPSWAPDYDASDRAGLSTAVYKYKTNAKITTSVNRDLGTLRVPAPSASASPLPPTFTRQNGASAYFGEPLLKNRFPLNRLAWITYKGPSLDVYTTNNSDPVITALLNAGVSLSTIQAGTRQNIKTCFGLVWDARSYVAAIGTNAGAGQQWIYTSPTSTNSGGNFDPTTNPGGTTATVIKTLDTVQNEAREPDFFELLQGCILTGSLGQNTNGGTTGTPQVFPDIHMSSTMHHLLSIGASIIDQADPDSIPTRIRMDHGAEQWIAYGVENLPYIAGMCAITGQAPDDSTHTKWAPYLLFQLWNQNEHAPATRPNNVRLRVDGGIGIYTGGNGQTWPTGGTFTSAIGQSIVLSATATFSPNASPLMSTNVTGAGSAAGIFATVPSSAIPAPTPAPPSGTTYVGFRLPADFTLSPGTRSKPPQLWLQIGATNGGTPNPFNATLEVDVGGGTYVPYNRFVGINSTNSWITSLPVFVREATQASGTPPDAFVPVDSPTKIPNCLVKADPRATRFGVVQLDTNSSTQPGSNNRIDVPLWQASNSKYKNGFGGTIGTGGGSTEVERVPLLFNGSRPYLPATLCLNTGASSNTATGYVDLDGVQRYGDTGYSPQNGSTNAQTPYDVTSPQYAPIVLDRPLQSVGELGYTFRDLPWRSLDFFYQNSADAGLLDVFTVTAEPSIVAGRVSVNTRQEPVIQAVMQQGFWDEYDATNLIALTQASGFCHSNTMATNYANYITQTGVLGNRSALATGLYGNTGFATALLRPANGIGHENEAAKTRREALARSIASMTQSRTWNLMIDVIAQSGKYPPTAQGLADFVVEGEKRYWLHIAIDRFTGEVIDQQLEAVYE